MAHPAVVDAVETRLVAGFSRCPVHMENSYTEAPAGGAAWILVDFPWSRSAQITIGAPGENVFREEGAFRVRLNVPAGSGARTGRTWLEEVAQLFRGKRFDGVETMAPQSPRTDDQNDIAGFYAMVLTVPYRADVTG